VAPSFDELRASEMTTGRLRGWAATSGDLLQLTAMVGAPVLEAARGRWQPGGAATAAAAGWVGAAGQARWRLGGRRLCFVRCKMWHLGMPRRAHDGIGFANLQRLRETHVD
jgi:hypothetical protein